SRVAIRRNESGARHVLDNAETARALGMLGPLLERWQRDRRRVRDDTERASAITNSLTYFAKAARLSLQILILGTGAWLVLQGKLTGGGMIAASLILNRALSPVERALGAWRSYLSVRTARINLANLFLATRPGRATLVLPKPAGYLTIENVRYQPRDSSEPIIRKVDLTLEPGETCGVIGPSGSGKSTLCRLIVGAWKPNVGHVRLDGAEVAGWDADEFGKHVGYLPQTVELFPGTIAQNIARMRESDDAAVIDAAILANVHEMVLSLPDGYETDVGMHGHRLSGGQKQRIALARALFGDPVLFVLDEPNANLDGAGDQALHQALVTLKTRGSTVIIVAHQPSTLRTADKVLVLREGRVAAFGERDKVLRTLMQRAPQPHVVSTLGWGGEQQAAAPKDSRES
ncbi:MAG: type I secretion system permease/ATPase, partial [Geminicoccaceae bacterium]